MRRQRLARANNAGRAISGVTDLLLGALALVLIFEGLLPFLSPGMWRAVFERATKLSDGQLRFLGLTSMLIGILLLAAWR
jgi:uncharacterized protein YjeT (DUF2065 family)